MVTYLPKFTIPQYQAFSGQIRDVRLEFLKGTLLAMPGAKPNHNAIALRLSAILDQYLLNKPCRVLTSDTRVYVPGAELFAFPDVVVMCEPEEIMFDAITVMNPSGLVEVLSPSTEMYDRITKLPAYLTIPSVKQVLLIAQEEIKIESFPDNNSYFAGEKFNFLDMEIVVDEVYRKVKW